MLIPRPPAPLHPLTGAGGPEPAGSPDPQTHLRQIRHPPAQRGRPAEELRLALLLQEGPAQGGDLPEGDEVPALRRGKLHRLMSGMVPHLPRSLGGSL